MSRNQEKVYASKLVLRKTLPFTSFKSRQWLLSWNCSNRESFLWDTRYVNIRRINHSYQNLQKYFFKSAKTAQICVLCGFFVTNYFSSGSSQKILHDNKWRHKLRLSFVELAPADEAGKLMKYPCKLAYLRIFHYHVRILTGICTKFETSILIICLVYYAFH